MGALNGIRLREWYKDRESEDVVDVADRLGVPISETALINTDETRRLFRSAQADLGISLGNRYIARSVYSIPRFGMINVHGEVLPWFRGAQSIIWPIYEDISHTGFTIHQINENIDRGNILYQDIRPIQFHATLRQTVEMNLAINRTEIPKALCRVCEDHEALVRDAKKQKVVGRSYTTPSARQFLRMLLNHRKMYRRQVIEATADQSA